MPYIPQQKRLELAACQRVPETAGEMNFLLTMTIQGYIQSKGGVSYQNINEVIGVLECVKLELYRRVASGYEDQKCIDNGDVYSVSSTLTIDSRRIS